MGANKYARSIFKELSDCEIRNKIAVIEKDLDGIISGVLEFQKTIQEEKISGHKHIKRTSDVVRIFSKKLMVSDMGLDEHFLELVIRSAPMHDLGKIGVDDAGTHFDYDLSMIFLECRPELEEYYNNCKE